VLKNISSAEAEIINYLGSQIQKEYVSEEVSTHNIVESSAGYVRNAIQEYVDGLQELPAEKEVAYLMGDFIDGKPILPLYCQLPSEHLGVSQFLESNAVRDHRGSLYLLERLEMLKTLEFRLKYSSEPDSAEFIFVWSQLTPFGLEVYQHCVVPSEEVPAKKKQSKKQKRKRSGIG
jgi:hypothetical protein